MGSVRRNSNLSVAGVGDYTLWLHKKSTSFIFAQNDFHFAVYREKEKQMDKIREKIAAKQQKKAR